MPAPLTPTEPDVVARLRAAGCVFAEDEARLLLGAAHTAAQLEAFVERRVAGVPLEHIVGWVEFCGLRIVVEAGVFVPRRRTEFLARQAAALARPGAVVLDLCCGSGAVGAAVADAVPGVDLHAADSDPAAVRCARRNIGEQVYEGDLYAAVPVALRGRVEVLIANAPYVPTDALAAMPPEARLHEPRVALDGGSDGLDVLRRVIADAPAWLAPGGHLLVESSEQQAPLLVDAMARMRLAARVARRAAAEATVVIGRRPILTGSA
jgi:release factor glutamine methyltransferase